MILSKQQLFSDDQAVTATAVGTNVIDLGVRGTPYGGVAPLDGDVGKGTKIPLLIQVTEDFADNTSLTFTVETSDAANLTSSTVLYTSGAVPVADLVEGFQLPVDVVPNGATGRYLGVRYTVGGSNATAGKITAGISMGNQTNITGA